MKTPWHKTRLILLCKAIVFFLLVVPAWAIDHNKASAPSADIYNKAVRLYEGGRWAEAKEYLHQYLAEYSETPLYITCLYYLGYCYQQLGDTVEALSIYHKVINEAKDQDAFWIEMSQRRINEINLLNKGLIG